MHETTIQATTVFTGRLLTLDVLEVEIEPGVRARREIVRHPGAVAVLAQTPDDRFVLVRQYRKAIDRDLLEVIAGGLAPGENPLVCAAREVKEETGYSVVSLRSLGFHYASPGFTDEVIHLFHAVLAAEGGPQQNEPDERITVVHLTRGEIEDLLAQGRIEDGKTLAAWLLFLKRPA